MGEPSSISLPLSDIVRNEEGKIIRFKELDGENIERIFKRADKLETKKLIRSGSSSRFHHNRPWEYFDEKVDHITGGRCFTRPIFDTEFDRHIYNLRFITGVDISNIDNYFPPESFNAIVGFNLGEGSLSLIKDNEEKLSKLLRTEGKLIVSGELSYSSNQEGHCPVVKNKVMISK